MVKILILIKKTCSLVDSWFFVCSDGVLGGFGKVTPTDTRDSHKFLDLIVKERSCLGFKLNLAADCGAGIGRVSKNLLLPRCNTVHLIEQSPRLIAAAPSYLLSAVDAKQSIESSSVFKSGSNIEAAASSESEALKQRVQFINVGLQVCLFEI
jgi:hypothetical protein